MNLLDLLKCYVETSVNDIFNICLEDIVTEYNNKYNGSFTIAVFSKLINVIGEDGGLTTIRKKITKDNKVIQRMYLSIDIKKLTNYRIKIMENNKNKIV
jgi:hypothetical protein